MKPALLLFRQTSKKRYPLFVYSLNLHLLLDRCTAYKIRFVMEPLLCLPQKFLLPCNCKYCTSTATHQHRIKPHTLQLVFDVRNFRNQLKGTVFQGIGYDT